MDSGWILGWILGGIPVRGGKGERRVEGVGGGGRGWEWGKGRGRGGEDRHCLVSDFSQAKQAEAKKAAASAQSLIS